MVFNNYVYLYTFDTVVKIIMSNITSQAATCNVKDMYVSDPCTEKHHWHTLLIIRQSGVS